MLDAANQQSNYVMDPKEAIKQVDENTYVPE